MLRLQGKNEAYRRGVKRHEARDMAAARAHYRAALADEPSRGPTESELELVRAHAPRLFTVRTEPLPLAHFAAVLHPRKPLIGYHMFWRDDIDYPDDDEPCDHEIVWVRYSAQTEAPSERVRAVYTYYHRHVLSSAVAVREARKNGGRPRFDIQWGKHGTLPHGWRTLAGGAVLRDMRETYERLSKKGIRRPDHPVASAWPKRFGGRWDDFVAFTDEVDTRAFLANDAMVRVSRLANAVIAQDFLSFNFAVKYSWPDGDRPGDGIY